MRLVPAPATDGRGRRRVRALSRVAIGCLLGLAVVLMVASPALNSPAGFSDVPESHPYRAAILDLASRQIINGFGDGTFRPNNPVSRQQFAKMIVKTLGYPVSDLDVCPFTDVQRSVPGGYVDPTDPNYPDHYVAVCAANHITVGKTPSSFAPYDPITHQQLITMVTRTANLPDPPGNYDPDFSPSQFSLAEHYLNARKAAYAGLLGGLHKVGPAYDFLASSTRGACAQILHNLLLRIDSTTTSGGSTTSSSGSTTSSSGSTTSSSSSSSSSSTSSSSTASSSTTSSSTTSSTLGNRSISGSVGSRNSFASTNPQGVVRAYWAAGGGLAGTASINPDRTFSITGLAPSVYRVRTVCSNAYQDQWWTPLWGVVPIESDPTGAGATLIDVTAGDASSKWFSLLGSHFISGRVVDPQGNPVAGIVHPWRDGRIVETQDIDPDGTFLVRLPPEAGYTLAIAPQDGHIAWWYGGDAAVNDPNGATATEIDLTNESYTGTHMVLDAYAVIQGSVSDTNAAPATGSVRMCRLDGTVAAEAVISGAPWVPGIFWSGPLLPGSYRVRTITNNLLDVWYGGAPVIEDPSGSTASIITLVGHENRELNFTLQIRRIISGTVRQEGGAPVSDGGVVAVNEAGIAVGRAKLGANGSYYFDDLEPGKYKVRTQETGFVDMWYKGGSVQEDPEGRDAPLVDVTSVHALNINFILRER